jgi:stage II sporulation protein AB (anti-sigma F factor)
MDNEITVIMKALSQNEAFARVAAAALAAQLDPLVSDINDLKTAVSEAVTNAIIHGYDGDGSKDVTLKAKLRDGEIYIEVSDSGRGIDDIEKAREPLFTSKPDAERSGLGFTVMEAFMDDVDVYSSPGKGTTVIMKKWLRGQD